MGPRVTIKVNGRRWRQVESFSNSGPNDRHCVATTADNETSVHFGDGTHGAAPPRGARVEATYRAGPSQAGEVTVSYRTARRSSPDQTLWVAIRNRSCAISFDRYRKFS